MENEIKDKEKQSAKLEEGITERKSALLKARQSSDEIESIINDLKSHIDRLKEEENDLNKSLQNLNKELKELDEKRHQVSTENDVLKGHAAQFEREKANAESENIRSLQEKDKILIQ